MATRIVPPVAVTNCSWQRKRVTSSRVPPRSGNGLLKLRSYSDEKRIAPSLLLFTSSWR